jgi:hypothetical protein
MDSSRATTKVTDLEQDSSDSGFELGALRNAS